MLNSYEIFYDKTRKMYNYNTVDCFIEVTTWTGRFDCKTKYLSIRYKYFKKIVNTETDGIILILYTSFGLKQIIIFKPMKHTNQRPSGTFLLSRRVIKICNEYVVLIQIFIKNM